ncbi:MAG: hypothetical protein DMG41_04375 [Acidobacteria bacterium]|nr:MAG: hypothetical protein AUH13_30155 [Acidobacteria bacterium 13_2_20CM_58_27]PYT67995.1 MAG: hypothetical protein DMG42_25385 [Acidobacteriota bacterium]PYT90571.1 MAG: hypothetical protein DMG41_04375 [Acidobacteriota bacterium]
MENPLRSANQEAAFYALANDPSPHDPGHAFPRAMAESNLLTGTELLGGVGRAKPRGAQVKEKSMNRGRTQI